MASTCAAELELTIPAVIDGIDNAVASAYGGWPDRLYLVGTDGRIAYLLRAWDPVRGNRVTLTLQDSKGAEVARMDLAKPLTIDNFEGLAAVPGPNGAIRFYLISDDNFSSSQRTLLVAFDFK